MKHQIHLLFFFLLFITPLLFGINAPFSPVISDGNLTIQPQEVKDTLLTNYDSVQRLLEDSPVVSMLDSLVQITFFREGYYQSDSFFLDHYRIPFETIPVISDSLYQARIRELSYSTPIELTFNSSVRQFIELYALQRYPRVGLSRWRLPLVHPSPTRPTADGFFEVTATSTNLPAVDPVGLGWTGGNSISTIQFRGIMF